MIGKTLGHYQIASQIGKGGMGEVYRAHDTKLNRDVALKVLPAEFANDPERMARFKREAQLLASLNHTNIAAIYGLEESCGVSALVMELAEGPTLAEFIAGKDAAGTAAVPAILKIALQIAEALEAAHEKGIIHRDLKPANIKVTTEGAVKVLDFGLAKALEGEAAVADASQSPTLSLASTKAGVILGTAAYMSPEQARGAAVDKRCDIWSFGVVLFEMLTGKQLFAGETISDTLAAVLRADVDWNLLPSNTPASIRTLLRRCLEKERKQRLQAIGEARIIIEEYLANPSSTSIQETASVAGRYKRFERLAWISAAVLLVAAIAVLGIVYFRKIFEPIQVTRLEYTLPEDQQFSNGSAVFLAVSPDGRKFAYHTNKGLFVRALDEWNPTLLADSNENPSNPFFSSNNEWVAYRSLKDNKLKKVSVNGGSPIFMCDVKAFSGAYWGADETIILSEYGNGLIRITDNGRKSEAIFGGDADNYYHPQLLPDGKSLLFTLSPYPYSIATRSPGSQKGILISPGDRAFYLPTGHLVYGLGRNLYAAQFNPSKADPPGDPVLIVEGVFRLVSGAPPQYDIAASGTLIYAADELPKRALVWVDRNGNEEPIDILPEDYQDYGVNFWSPPRISPDGKKLAFAATKGKNVDIWIRDLASKQLIKITDDEGVDNWPIWTSDSKKIVYWTSRDFSRFAINRRAVDRSGEIENLGSMPPTYPFLLSWSKADEEILASELLFSPERMNIVILSIKGGVASKPLLKGNEYIQDAHLSPNGKWLAYTSNENNGRNDVYVCQFPDVNSEKQMVSTNGGYGPLWSREGDELFYRNGDSVMAVAVETQPILRLGKPQELFKGKYCFQSDGANMWPLWDISPADKRFLMIKETESTASAAGARKINIVLNWFEELKKLVPMK